jgi:hypothetical protein
MQLEFPRVTSLLKDSGHLGHMKIKNSGLNEEREVHSQVGLSSLLGHAMINSSSFKMLHSDGIFDTIY